MYAAHFCKVTGVLSVASQWSLVALLGIAVTPHAVAHGDRCVGSIDVTEIEWLTDPSGQVDRVKVTFSGEYYRQAGAPSPELQVKILDCEGAELEIITLAVPQVETGHTLTLFGPDDFTHVLNCTRVPANMKFETKCGGGDLWSEVAIGGAVALEPSFECPYDPAKWACFDCPGQDPFPAGSLRFLKEERTLYTLPTDARGPATAGEVVNGAFFAPTKGELLVSVTGNSDQANVHGGIAANQPGYHTATERGGTLMDTTPRCISMGAAGDRFEFNVLAGKGNATSGITVTFDWQFYNTETCCIESSQSTLQLKIEPMVVKSSPIQPNRPNRRTWAGMGNPPSGASPELRLPMCKTCQPGHVCERGNLSKWFVAWPTAPGKTIPNGHALGWKVEGNNLLSSEPNQLKYVFAPQ